MTATATRAYRLGEFHSFEAAKRRFLYLVPAGAIFELDDAAAKLIERLSLGETVHEELMDELVSNGYSYDDADELLGELYHSHVIVSGETVLEPLANPPADFPLQSLVMNLTNQCNLSCTYCYEFGEDKVATPEGKPKFMDIETAKASVDFLLAQSAGRKSVHITFFGGETLMNFPLLKRWSPTRTSRRRRRADQSTSASRPMRRC